MDNHPIPQDVTGFQFRLIGDMTVKQFGYLSAGVVLAWIVYQLPFYFLIKYPLILLFGGIGAGLAFLPIEGRPLDVMIVNFIKALFSADQYVYQKRGGDLAMLKIAYHPATTARTAPTQQDSEKLQKYLAALPHTPKNKLDEKELSYFESLFGSSSPLPPTEQPVATPKPLIQIKPQITIQMPVRTPQPSLQVSSPPRIVEQHDEERVTQLRLQQAKEKEQEQEAEKKKETLDKKAETIKHDLEDAKRKEQEQKTVQQALLVHQKALELENQLQEALKAKKEVEDRYLELSKKMNAKPQKEVFEPSEGKIAVRKETLNVRRIPKGMGVKIGLPIASDVPNVIIGIIKDSRDNILPNILVEVKDKRGHPVRAFKTNTLGQFASATPLSPGTYTIEFEDPQGKHKFDSVAINAGGEIIQPLEVISTDAREELRRDLFGTTPS